MFSPLVVFLSVVVAAFATPTLLIWWYEKQQEKQWPRQIEEIVEAECKEIERRAEAIAECLLELGLPQLEEKTKRLEIARRLCIAIFGR